ncbi:MAG: cobalt ABC transporter permease [Chloroflexi bacterium]|nr:cobalt ABC transporter permease [Chloroflexota bacterium]MCL5109138.1 cobalt ABC transporter permease [Chloroflexota bacterium]
MTGKRALMLAGVLLAAMVLVSLFIPSQWEGVDVSVVQTRAQQMGGTVANPLINVTGDLQLFMFTIAGAIGGFIVGYSWRSLFGTPAQEQREGQKKASDRKEA